ncbi:MAG TPA: chitobiase/beta-hexosaminidase C-terminal domain-containing protein, partial [Chthoniobacterales bacterium]|nr:chitobiase/beta-hexosaminidase C-terminal domain-containing protein [Chthoniobacterales bacterium]
TPNFDLTTPVSMGANVTSGENINPDGLVGQINLAIDRSGSATNNSIYLAASLQRSGVFNGSDVMFVRSTNGGQTFSAPVRINDDPLNPNKWHWFAALAVAPNGRIDCVWLDTRNAVNNVDSQLFYSFSQNGGQTWSPNIPVSGTFDPTIGYPHQNKIGDYITVVSDNNGANVAYSATFNGEQDVYYLRIPIAGIPTYNISVSAAPADGGSITGGGSYPIGATVNLTATPNVNHQFVNWSENGAVVSTSPVYNFSAGADRALLANFVFAPQTAAPPVFSPAGGTFRRKVRVRMMSATPGARIFYTLNGSDPTTASRVYPANRPGRPAGIQIAGRGVKVVKAIAVAPGFTNSSVSTTSYRIR